MASSGQRRRSRAKKAPPESACQTLVTRAGTTIRGMATLRPRVTVRRARATVGKPVPISPFTRPPMRKAAATRSRVSVVHMGERRDSRELEAAGGRGSSLL